MVNNFKSININPTNVDFENDHSLAILLNDPIFKKKTSQTDKKSQKDKKVTNAVVKSKSFNEDNEFELFDRRSKSEAPDRSPNNWTINTF